MSIQPIVTKQDYLAKLARVEILMDTSNERELNESEEQELKDLVVLIEAYENIHYPM